MREIEWNDDKPTLIFMYGYPAAGKTTYSRLLYNHLKLQYKDVILISADQIRELLYGSEDIYGNPQEVYVITRNIYEEKIVKYVKQFK